MVNCLGFIDGNNVMKNLLANCSLFPVRTYYGIPLRNHPMIQDMVSIALTVLFAVVVALVSFGCDLSCSLHLDCHFPYLAMKVRC